MDSIVQINVALARAFGLELKNLKGFKLVVAAGSLPVVTADYGVIDTEVAERVRVIVGAEPAKAA